MSGTWRPMRFIGHEVQVAHREPPVLAKRPPAPDSFVWQRHRYQVVELLSAWTRHERRGRSRANMQPAHLETAVQRGSWGVGRFYFRVRTDRGGVFDLYYDRAPESAGDRAGHWFLWRELTQR